MTCKIFFLFTKLIILSVYSAFASHQAMNMELIPIDHNGKKIKMIKMPLGGQPSLSNYTIIVNHCEDKKNYDVMIDRFKYHFYSYVPFVEDHKNDIVNMMRLIYWSNRIPLDVNPLILTIAQLIIWCNCLQSQNYSDLLKEKDEYKKLVAYIVQFNFPLIYGDVETFKFLIFVLTMSSKFRSSPAQVVCVENGITVPAHIKHKKKFIETAYKVFLLNFSPILVTLPALSLKFCVEALRCLVSCGIEVNTTKFNNLRMTDYEGQVVGFSELLSTPASQRVSFDMIFAMHQLSQKISERFLYFKNRY